MYYIDMNMKTFIRMICSLFVNDTATTEIYTYGHTLSLHDALPISRCPPSTARCSRGSRGRLRRSATRGSAASSSTTTHSATNAGRSEEHTSELQSLMRISYAVYCFKKKINTD